MARKLELPATAPPGGVLLATAIAVPGPADDATTP